MRVLIQKSGLFGPHVPKFCNGQFKYSLGQEDRLGAISWPNLNLSYEQHLQLIKSLCIRRQGKELDRIRTSVGTARWCRRQGGSEVRLDPDLGPDIQVWENRRAQSLPGGCPIQKLTVPDFQHITNVYEQMQQDNLDKPAKARKQMKPFTIRKAAQPSRAGASAGLVAGDMSMDASMNKYNTTGGPDRGNSVNYGPLTSAKDDTPTYVDPEDETLLEKADLDKLAEDYPGKLPENPWIKEQTNKQFLTSIKGLPARHVNVYNAHKHVKNEQKFSNEETKNANPDQQSIEAKAILDREYDIFQDPMAPPEKALTRYDTWDQDRTIEEWLRYCEMRPDQPHAISPCFADNEYAWKPVRVVGYDYQVSKYKVEVCNTRQIKFVTRLSLLFYAEDPGMFRERVNLCKTRLKNCFAELAFTKEVDKVKHDAVSTLSKERRESFMRKCIQESDRFEQNAIYRTFSDLMRVVQEEYIRQMKKCIIQQEMHDPANFAKYINLKVPIRLSKYTYPYFGVVSSKKYNYMKYKSRIFNAHWCSDADIAELTAIFSKKSLEFVQKRYMNTERETLRLPLQLDEMKKEQSAHCDSISKNMQIQWREFLVSEIRRKLRETHNIFESDIEKYSMSRLKNIIQRFELILNNFMREFSDLSIKDWVNFIRSFTVPKTEKGELWDLSSDALLSVKLEILKPAAKNDKKKPKVAKKTDEDGEEQEPEEDDTSKRIRYKPNLKECEDFMLGCLEQMRNTTNDFLCLEKDLVTFLNLKDKASFDLNSEFPWLIEARSQIQAMFKENQAAPQALLEQFKKYEYILNVDKKRLIKDLFDRPITEENLEKKAPFEEIAAQLKKFHTAEYEILNIANDVIDFPVFQVRAQDLKQRLAKEASAIKLRLQERIYTWCSDSVKLISTTYDHMQKRIGKAPDNEEELVDLREFIKTSKEVTQIEMLSLQHQVEKNYELLDEFSYIYNIDDIQNCWTLKQYPMIIGEAIADGNTAITTQEEQFIAKLDAEKEQFLKDLAGFKDTFKKIQTFQDIETLPEFFKEAATLNSAIEQSRDKVETFNMREARLNQAKSEYTDFDELRTNFDPFYSLLQTAYESNRMLQEFGTSALLQATFTYEEVAASVDQWQKTLFKLAKSLNENYPDASDAAIEFKKKVDGFSLNLPLMKCIMSEALHEEDWGEIKKAIDNIDLDPQTISVAKFGEQKITGKIADIEEITNRAEKKFQLSKKLKVMKEEMKEFKLTTIPYKDQGTFVLKAYDEVNAKLDDQMVQTQAMLGSSNCVLKLRTDTKNWETKLTLMQDIIIEINKCQKQWMYLEPIFSSDDIGKTLAAELASFQDVDKVWKQVLEGIDQEPGLYDLAERDNILSNFQDNNRKLERILRSLNEYLEEKRLVFPRFYFLANEDLLMILAQTKDPTLVQKHMDKCFEGIQKVQFSDKQEVTAMVSAEQEVVQLFRKIDVNEGDKKGNVEKWMLEIEKVMRMSLKMQTQQSIADYYNSERTEWVQRWPGQVVLAVDQIDWTKGVEDVFADMREGKMEAFKEEINQQILASVQMVRGQLTNQMRTTLKALVVIDVHGREVVQELIDEQVQSKDDFAWGSQLRYYFVQQKKDYVLEVKMVTAQIDYGFEYLGNSPRLVITPLTDRCYRTLMGAKNLDYGGAPEGPAGTGKTESVKDLAKALAVQCVVFNCSDGLDHNSMGKFFKGLASAGAWCCFDEFNRIDLEVLSVVAQQILQIQRAIKAKKTNFDFEDTPNLVLNHACCVNITMNPGYAGRSELPDNLKALFRPCAMMVPNYALIAEIELYSFGFSDAKSNAVKVCASLIISSEQLSSQAHYDFGMRALKAILTACGNLRRILDWSEDQISLRALKDVNLPKFTSSDIPLYTGITNDLFPGIELPSPDYNLLTENMNGACKAMNIQPKAEFLKKCIQLYETIMVRHGLMVVGGAYSGKSKVIKTLQNAFTRINNDDYKPVETHYINPKSILQTQLYGYNDEDSGEWTDGVLALKIALCANSDTDDRKWVIFDGPVDAVWIENMNTVLDDNKKLCLSSGAIIKLKPTMTIMFEVEDLSQASPATVSRCGMVLLEPHELGHNVLIQSFVDDIALFIEEKIINKLGPLMHYIANVTVRYIYRNCKFPVPTGPNFVIDNMLKVFDTFIRHWKPTEDDEISKIPANAEDICMNALIFAFIWGVGAQIDEFTRMKFDEFFQDVILGEDVNDKYKLELEEEHPEPLKIKTHLGSEYQSLFDISFIPDETKWTNWMKTQDPYEVPVGESYAKVIVPTIDSIRTNSIVLRMLTNMKHTLLCGLTGTGKSISVLNQLNDSFQNENWTYLSLAFSAQTSANQTQSIIDGSMDRRRKGVWGPKVGKKAIIFVDDLNMPMKEKYGAQPPIELLRQWMDYEGWYELDGEKDFRKTVGVTFCAAMQPPGGSKTITNRYVRHYNVVYIEPYSDDSLKTIFGSVMEWMFMSQTKHQYSSAVKSQKDKMVAATISTYQEIQKRFRPTPAKSHYTYNLRDVSKVFQGISKSDPRAIPEENNIIKLWAHECMRVFQDRLISQTDRDLFMDLLKEKTRSQFRKEIDDIIEVKPLLFGSFTPTIYPDGDTTKRPIPDLYCELITRDLVKKNCESQLEEFNTMNRSKAMDLVLFTDAIEHIVKIHRVITTQFGNALLVGVGGSGRKSLSELATFIAQYEMVQLEIIKGYSMKDWREDMVNSLFGAAGVDSINHVFLMADTQIINEAFVEDINNILNNGMIPNLYSNEDITTLVESMKDMNKNGEKSMEDGEVMSIFEEQAKNSIHVVLAFSPIGDDFKRRLRMFPALVNCCTIDWFLPWPSDALRSVADQFLSKVENLPMKDGIVQICVDMQERVRDLTQRYLFELKRYYYVTPTSYLILIKTFTKLLDDRRNENYSDIQKYERGLTQMAKAATQATEIKEKLIELIPQLKKQAEEAVITQREVEAKKVEVDREVIDVNKEADAAKIEADKAGVIEADCNEALQKVMPIYYRAIAAVERLSSSDVKEMSGVVKPSSGLEIVAQSLCYFFIDDPLNERQYKNKKEKASDPDTFDYWVPCKKKVLANQQNPILKAMKGFDKDNFNPDIVTAMNPLLSDPRFTDAALKNAGKAALGIGSWCKAIIEYDNAMKIVKPKQAELKVAKAASAAANAIKEEAEARLAAKEAELKACVDKLDEVQRQEKYLRDEHDSMQAKKALADLLISSLEGEKISWQASLVKGKADSLTIEGDILICSGVMAYLGVFSKSYRDECVTEWVKLLQKYNITASENVSLNEILGEQVKIVAWTSCDLPSDEFSIENAIIMDYSERWSLMIDPQMQANKWLKKQYKGAEKESSLQVQIVKPTMSSQVLSRKLEACITMGNPVIFEDATETFDPMLDPLLAKQIEKKSSEYLIKFGEKFISYNQDFKFFITTKMPAPHYSPEVCVKVTILNFMVTQDGLQDQMLNEIIRIEEFKRYEQRNKCIVSKAENAIKKKAVDNTILGLLANSKEDILEDTELRESLAESKEKQAQIEQSNLETESTMKIIEKIRTENVSVGLRVSRLFFVLTDLTNVDPMYQYSLDFFKHIFAMTLKSAEEAGIDKTKRAEKRAYWVNEFTRRLYSNVSRSLFQRHILLFSFLLCLKIIDENLLLTEGGLNLLELRFLMAGATQVDITKPNPSGEDGWLSDKAWLSILEMSTKFDTFKGFDDDFITNVSHWEKIYNSSSPQSFKKNPWPGKWTDLRLLQKTMIMRALRPDKVIPMLQKIVKKQPELGKEYLIPPQSDLNALYKDSKNNAAIIIVISPGADPMTEIDQFSAAKKIAVKSLSLGRGQAKKAIDAIKEAKEIPAKAGTMGTWVVLQNCHLAPSFMPQLDALIEDIVYDENASFRIWMTTEPSDKFPVTIVQNGTKMTSEPPKGIQQNCLKSYRSIKDNDFDSCTKPVAFRRLLWGLCFFNAVILERRKFGPLGWNKAYEFSASDLSISMKQLVQFLDFYDEVPFPALTYMVAQANYGGRVTDPQDRRCIETLLLDYYNSDMIEIENNKLSPSGTYYVPSDGSRQDYIEFIQEKIPLNDLTEVFGLHDNADITSAINATDTILGTALSLQPRATNKSGKTQDEVLSETCQGILEKLPPILDLELARKNHPVKYEESMNTVLENEILRFNKLLFCVRDSLKNIQLAIKGEVVMSSDLEEVGNALFDNRIPATFAKVSYPSLKPLASYIVDLVERLSEINKWILSGKPPNFWLSGFFFTQSFLTGLKQNFARKYTIAIDQIGWEYEVLEDSKFSKETEAPDGAYVHGLYLEGCRWDHEQGCLEESEPKVLYTKMPYIWLKPAKVDDIVEKHSYTCPVYKTLERFGVLSTTGHSTNFVCMMEIPMQRRHNEAHWTKRGVAMITQLND